MTSTLVESTTENATELENIEYEPEFIKPELNYADKAIPMLFFSLAFLNVLAPFAVSLFS